MGQQHEVLVFEVAGQHHGLPMARVRELGRAVALSPLPASGGFRPSRTYLFESAARVYAARTLAEILTGMGEDGVQGLRAVRQAGHRMLAQDALSLEGIAACLTSAVRPPG